MIREYVEEAIENAGGYTKGVENKPDSNMGITQNMLTEYRGNRATSSDLQHLTRAEAEQITYERLWQATGFSALETKDSVTKLLFEVGVTYGPTESVVLLQRALDVPPTGILEDETKWGVKHEDPEVLVTKIQRRLDKLKKRLRA